jgi:hypothetical protein
MSSCSGAYLSTETTLFYNELKRLKIEDIRIYTSHPIFSRQYIAGGCNVREEWFDWEDQKKEARDQTLLPELLTPPNPHPLPQNPEGRTILIN